MTLHSVTNDTELKLHWTQVQKLSGASKQTIYRWMDDGTLKYEQLKKGRLVLILQSELDKLINDFKTGMYQDVTLQNYDSSVTEDDVTVVSRQNNDTVQGVTSDRNTTHYSDNFVMMEMLQIIKNQLANKDNEIKLLEDSENKTKETYFEIKAERDFLRNRNKELEDELLRIKTELDVNKNELKETKILHERNKAWWKLGK